MKHDMEAEAPIVQDIAVAEQEYLDEAPAPGKEFRFFRIRIYVPVPGMTAEFSSKEEYELDMVSRIIAAERLFTNQGVGVHVSTANSAYPMQRELGTPESLVFRESTYIYETIADSDEDGIAVYVQSLVRAVKHVWDARALQYTVEAVNWGVMA